MKARAFTGTDIATVAVWDAARQADVLPAGKDRAREAAIAADLAAAALFVIHTGGDGSGAVDIYVDEEPPADVLAGFRPVGAEHRFTLASGKLAADGLEYYRVDAKHAALKQVIEVPAGDYGIRCHSIKDEEAAGAQPDSRKMDEAIGEESARYFNRVQKRGALGCWMILLAPVLWPLLGGMWAAGIVLAIMLGWSQLHEYGVARDRRYQEIVRQREAYWEQAEADAPATMLLVLRRLTGPSDLQGGSVDLRAAV